MTSSKIGNPCVLIESLDHHTALYPTGSSLEQKQKVFLSDLTPGARAHTQFLTTHDLDLQTIKIQDTKNVRSSRLVFRLSFEVGKRQAKKHQFPEYGVSAWLLPFSSSSVFVLAISLVTESRSIASIIAPRLHPK